MRPNAEHPRARGENGVDGIKEAAQGGTSPRTRGKPVDTKGEFGLNRNIPAHAGKTSLPWWWPQLAAEHPRARGENYTARILNRPEGGTSPRTRGKRDLQ